MDGADAANYVVEQTQQSDANKAFELVQTNFTLLRLANGSLLKLLTSGNQFSEPEE